MFISSELIIVIIFTVIIICIMTIMEVKTSINKCIHKTDANIGIDESKKFIDMSYNDWYYNIFPNKWKEITSLSCEYGIVYDSDKKPISETVFISLPDGRNVTLQI